MIPLLAGSVLNQKMSRYKIVAFFSIIVRLFNAITWKYVDWISTQFSFGFFYLEHLNRKWSYW